MSNFPSYMSFFLRSYNNVSHQNFMVQPASSGVLNAHRQMQFTLPTNAMLHLSKTRLLFTMSTSSTGTTTAGRLSAAKSIIDRIEISAGGVSLSSGCASSAVLAQCIDNMRTIEEDPVTSHTELYRATSGVNGRPIQDGDEAYTNINNAQCFSIELGPWFQTMQPNMLPTQILPTLQATIYLSGNATVVSSCTLPGTNIVNPLLVGDVQSTYTVDNYTLSVSAYSLDDGVFDQTLATRLNSSEGLEASFCNYESFSNTFSTGSTRVSSAASSLDKVIVCFRASGFDGIKSAVGVQGYNSALTAGLLAAGVLDQPATHGGAKYLNHTANFTTPSVLPSAATDNWAKQPTISIQVNNVRFPSYDARIGAQTYELLKEAFETDKTACQSLVEYMENRCQLAYKFNLPASQAMRARSGLNLQGSNSSILIEAVGDKTDLTNDGNIMVFVESTQVIKIMAGKQLMVVS